MRTPLLFASLLTLVTQASFAAPPQHFWSRDMGGASNDATSSVAVVPGSGDIVATGYFTDTIDLGGGTLDAAGDNASDMWVARYTSSGQLKWGKRFGSVDVENGNAIAVDAAGNTYVTGSFNGIFSIGNFNLGGTNDFYVAKFDPLGEPVWAYGYGGGGYENPGGLAVDASGNVIVCGSFVGTASFGGPGVVAVGSSSTYIVKYNSAGEWQWNVVGAGPSLALSVGTDNAGNVYATGYFETTVTFPGFAPLVTAGSLEMFLVKINSAGTVQFAQRRGGTGAEVPLSIAVTGSGHMVVTGVFTETSNFGGSALVSAGGYDMFVARYLSDGTYSFSMRQGGVGEDVARCVRYDATGNIVIGGSYGSAIDLGGGTLPFGGVSDIFIAKYTTTKVHIWSRGVGGTGEDFAFSIADLAGQVVIGGAFDGMLNLGGENLVPNGTTDGFIAKFGLADPDITTIKDVGNDQGRNVRITVARSGMDDGTAALPVTEYRAYRRVLPVPAASGDGRVVAADPPGLWEFVAAVPATNALDYRIIAPTPADSTITDGMYLTKFFVRAATSNPSVYFDSPVDSGYSVDNLAPGVPTNFTFESGQLAWDDSKAGDFDFFTVYGANTYSFSAATLVDYTVATGMDVTASPYAYYFVTATDFSGNEGRPAAVTTLTGAGETPKQYVLSISAYPNPFNPETSIRYTLPESGDVTIAVFDARGAHVTTLVQGSQGAGAHVVAWDGRSASGEGVGSGVYFARVSTATGSRTYKLTLLK